MEVTQINQSYPTINNGFQASSPSNIRESDFQAEFQQMLTTLMFGQTLNPLGGNSGQSGLFGNDFFSPLMMLLISSMEDSSLNLNTFTTQQNTLDMEGIFQQARSVQINQFDAERQVGGDGANANCGPTALTMALHGLGIAVAGETVSDSAGRTIDLARRSMITDSYRDGVDQFGNRAEFEHNSYTNFSDLIHGASMAGAKSQLVNANAEAIREALLNGKKVIVSGTFAGKSPLPWTGDRGHDNQSAPGGATAHFVTVSGYDPQRDLYVINDPARRTPLAVTGSTLEYFMRGNAGALSIGNY